MTDELAPQGPLVARSPEDRVRLAALALMPAAAVIYIVEWYMFVMPPLWHEQFLAFFLGLTLFATFLPGTARPDRGVGRMLLDRGFALLSLVVFWYAAWDYPRLIVGAYGLDKFVLGGIAVFLVLEGTRRLVGWAIVVLCLAMIVYAFVSPWMPGPFRGSGQTAQLFFSYLYVDRHAILGTPLSIASTIVIAFVLFGETLKRAGASSFINDLAVLLTGNMKGGPAKVAVMSSTFFGTISGSGVSNVVMSGTVTIPMMMKAGYRANLAGAVEATASTGGSLLPPIMGAAVFIMADFLQVPYAELAIAALIPALLYYLCLFLQVDLIARRDNIETPRRHFTRQQIVDLLLRRSFAFVLPLGLLIAALFVYMRQPQEAGLWAAALAFAFYVVLSRPWPRELGLLLASCGQAMLQLVVVCAAAGLLMGVIVTTGVGNKLSGVLIFAAGGQVFVLALLIAVASIVLGMGLPATAVYILLATLLAPVLGELGIYAVAAHMFIYYFGNLSLITPPVCLAAFAAATLSGGSAMRTGWESIKMGVVAFVVPFIFLFSPTLLMQGTAADIVRDTVFAAFGVAVLSVALVGWFGGRFGMAPRILLVAGGLLMFFPAEGDIWLFTWFSDAVGMALSGTILAFAWLRRERRAANAA